VVVSICSVSETAGVREPQTARPEARRQEPAQDSLNAKVQAALEARQRGAVDMPQRDEAAREALRGELRAIDREALRQATRTDRVGSAWNERPMTVQDAARLADPAYAASADRTALLREEAAAVEKQIGHYEGVLHHYTVERWHAMGFLRQAMHKAGVGKDRWMGLSEDGERSGAAALDKLEPRRAVLARRLPEAEKREAAAFERAQPAATAELAKRRERASLAREIMAERRQEQDQARERQRERNRDRDHGVER
jgi:hypothetical protein